MGPTGRARVGPQLVHVAQAGGKSMERARAAHNTRAVGDSLKLVFCENPRCSPEVDLLLGLYKIFFHWRFIIQSGHEHTRTGNWSRGGLVERPRVRRHCGSLCSKLVAAISGSICIAVVVRGFHALINHLFIAPAACFAHTITTLLYEYCAIYDPPPRPPFVCHAPYHNGYGNIV